MQEYQKQQRDPFALIWMEQNFTNSWKNLSSGRWYVTKSRSGYIIYVIQNWYQVDAFGRLFLPQRHITHRLEWVYILFYGEACSPTSGKSTLHFSLSGR